jgi:ABC-type Zn uptake system ZnuABC Zn-binding protein ZnuA
MKRAILSLLVSLLTSASAAAELRVVTTIPDLADIVREIGGDRVRVDSLAKGTMNIHSVPLRPSALVKVNKADLFVQMGLSLEHSFVPGLLMGARNRRIEPSAPGFVNCSVGWEAIDVPAEVDRGQTADIHPEGNPHFNLDPRSGRHMARQVLDGLVRVDPGSKDYYEERHAAYVEKLEAAETRWEAMAEKMRGTEVVTYHFDFDYFARSRGMVVVDTIEPKPGVPPAPRDLAQIIALMKEKGVKLVLTAKWSNNKSVRFVAQKAGARVLELPVLVGGVEGTETWIGMMDHLHDRLAAALAP